MVWARAKLMIEEDLLAPNNLIRIKFSGKNPEKFYKEIQNLMITAFRVHDHSIQEKEFQWTKGETERFSISWEVNKDLDKFSYYYFTCKLSGESSKGFGNADIDVEGVLRTEYPQDTFWQRSLLYEILRMFWHTVFYDNKRTEYMKHGRLLLAFFCDQVKNLTRV